MSATSTNLSRLRAGNSPFNGCRRMHPLVARGAITRLTWHAAVLGATLSAMPARAETNDDFKLLTAPEIRTQIVGKDIAQSARWSLYFRSDGRLESAEFGEAWTGEWSTRDNKLCMALPAAPDLTCADVWMSGASVRMGPTPTSAASYGTVVPHHAG